jgi:hypothetical protein
VHASRFCWREGRKAIHIVTCSSGSLKNLEILHKTGDKTKKREDAGISPAVLPRPSISPFPQLWVKTLRSLMWSQRRFRS